MARRNPTLVGLTPLEVALERLLPASGITLVSLREYPTKRGRSEYGGKGSYDGKRFL